MFFLFTNMVFCDTIIQEGLLFCSKGEKMRFFVIIPLMLCAVAANAADDLSAAVGNARAACGGIGGALDGMKTMAGINTAITGVGTVAGGVALGTGIAKSGVDSDIEDLEKQIEELRQRHSDTPIETLEIADPSKLKQEQKELLDGYHAIADQKDIEEQKSKELGNWRTGSLAASSATNIAGAVIAGTNRVGGDLKSKISECLESIKTLSAVRMQARISNTATEPELARAENIIKNCENWATVDIDSINNKSAGAAVSSGVGAGLGIAGTVTSASANSQSVRDGDVAREKNLNTAANVLAGGTTVASGVATVFNATQISAIKRATTVAEACERALKQ